MPQQQSHEGLCGEEETTQVPRWHVEVASHKHGEAVDDAHEHNNFHITPSAYLLANDRACIRFPASAK